MKTLNQIIEAINDDKTDEEYHAMNKLHDSLSDHYHFDTDVKQRHEHMKDMHGENHVYNEPAHSDIKIRAIHNYTQGSGLNNHLWEVHKGNVEMDSVYKKDVGKLDNALNYHKTPHDLTVYSTSRHDPRVKKNENNIVHHPAYISTSIDKDYARDWGGSFEPQGIKDRPHKGRRVSHVLAIHIPKGHSGAYVEHCGVCPGQHEFILPRGQNLKYHHTESFPGKTKWGDTSLHHFHHMSIEPSEDKK